MPGEYVAGFDKPLAHMETGRDFIPRFYNVHAFVGHLRGILVFKQEAVVRANIHSCLRDDALDWFNTELTHSERVELRNLPVEQGWFKRLIQRFKIPYEIALFRVETAELYRKEVLISRSARNMVRHLQAVGIDSLEEQLSFVWKRLRMFPLTHERIAEPDPGTSMSEFMREIDAMNWEHVSGKRDQDRLEDISFGNWEFWCFDKYEKMNEGEEMSEELKTFLKKHHWS